jgi:biotin transporter BioY
MKETRSISSLAGALPGYLVGLLWLAMAAAVIWTAARGHANGRSDWALGWGLVGFFLTAAALSALIGTWWHHSRVKKHHH